MTAIAEAAPADDPHNRDMSRAHWMRSVGTVVMREMGERFFGRLPTEITEDDILTCEHWAEEYDTQLYGLEPRSEPSVAARAFAIAEHFLVDKATMGFTARKLFPHDDALEEEFEEHTHFKSTYGAFEEGLRAEAVFPINLAFWTAAEAKEKGVEGFSVDTLSDVAAMLRRPDFQTLVDISALTRNGLWGTFSTNRASDHKYRDYAIEGENSLELEFVNGNVTYDGRFKRFLREEMARVNRQGVSATRVQVTGRVSSGCPARWTRPHFTDDPEDARNLEMLSRDFGKPAAELTEKRDPVIITSMNYLADMLEKADVYYNGPKAGTSSK